MLRNVELFKGCRPKFEASWYVLLYILSHTNENYGLCFEPELFQHNIIMKYTSDHLVKHDKENPNPINVQTESNHYTTTMKYRHAKWKNMHERREILISSKRLCKHTNWIKYNDGVQTRRNHIFKKGSNGMKQKSRLYIWLYFDGGGERNGKECIVLVVGFYGNEVGGCGGSATCGMAGMAVGSGSKVGFRAVWP